VYGRIIRSLISLIRHTNDTDLPPWPYCRILLENHKKHQNQI